MSSDVAAIRAELTQRLRDLGELRSSETALFHQEAAAVYGLGITDMKALQLLLQDGPLTPGDLAGRLKLTSGAVTSVLDRLERREMILREPHPDDRRKVIVRADHEKLAAGENVYASIGDAFATLHDGLTIDQLRFLIEYYESSIALTRAETAKLSGRGSLTRRRVRSTP
jgi:MarR family transcriptional regulator, organic hydroperoxide resistance regulator